MKTGIELMAAERERQVGQECFTSEHDDQHVNGELAGAGACYALARAGYVGRFVVRLVMALWPWNHEWWKPNREDPVPDLVKAGALMAAEIDRLQRRQAREERPRILRPGE